MNVMAKRPSQPEPFETTATHPRQQQQTFRMLLFCIVRKR